MGKTHQKLSHSSAARLVAIKRDFDAGRTKLANSRSLASVRVCLSSVNFEWYMRHHSSGDEYAARDLCQSRLREYDAKIAAASQQRLRRGIACAKKVVMGRLSGRMARRSGSWQSQSNSTATATPAEWVTRSQLILAKARRPRSRITQNVEREFRKYLSEPDRILPSREPLVKRCKGAVSRRLKQFYMLPPPKTYIPPSEASIVSEVFRDDVYSVIVSDPLWGEMCSCRATAAASPTMCASRARPFEPSSSLRLPGGLGA